VLIPDPARVGQASRRFERFFSELRHTFVERDDLLSQVALALLAKEHVLLTGPPGTAKSQVAAAVLGRILDEQTGRPSLYARQFTESTVQTDLVGPINFKTLMDTGRTEHFTDQGILGAVHAFLDEVFDGRDMLLRAALNVLHERELKEGTKTTRGQIECAMMTSNRYLAEVLEGSRDTLLAFVDRVAFIAFMPRGFADPQNLAAVLRRHVGGTGRVQLTSPLSVQDLDALQAAVDAVHVSEAACDAIAAFLEALELELSSAAKADPSFVPTRYVSTRTAVRCGRVLRAIAVYDKIFRRADRPLEVLPVDFESLRLHVLLAGPSPEMIEKLLAKETDPRERRQLSIIRTERDAFERCLRKVPKFVSSSAATTAGFAGIEHTASVAIESGDPSKLADSINTLLPLTQTGGAEADRAASLVRQITESLATRALRAGLAPSTDEVPDQTAAELAALAAQLEATPAGHTRALARWLRGRALALLDETAAFDPGAESDDLALVVDDQGGGAVPSRIAKRVKRLARLADLRESVLAAGVDVDLAASTRAWSQAIARVEDDIALLLDAGFRRSVADVLARTPRDQLGDVLAGLSSELASLDALGEELGKLAGRPSRLKERVVGPRIGDLLAAIFRAIDASDHDGLLRNVATLREVLRSAELGRAIDPAQWTSWSASALVRAEREVPPAASSPGHDAYRALRTADQRRPIAVTLREISVSVASLGELAPDEAEKAIRELLAQVPDPLRAEAASLDFQRIERALAHLEAWWKTLARDETEPVQLDDARARLDAVIRSRFLRVVLDEQAFLRFALEARVVGETFPALAERAAELRERIDGLARRVRSHVVSLGRAAGDRAWSEVLDAS